MSDFFDSLILDETLFDPSIPRSKEILRRIKMGKTYYYITTCFDLDDGTLRFDIKKVMVMNFPYLQLDEPLVKLSMIILKTNGNKYSDNLTIYRGNIPITRQKKDIIRLSNYQAFCKDKQAAHKYIKNSITDFIAIRGIIGKSHEDKSINNILNEYKETVKKLKQCL